MAAETKVRKRATSSSAIQSEAETKVRPRSKPSASLTEDERHVLELLQREPLVFDAIAALLTPKPFTVQRLSVLLLNLEMKQQIRQLPGRTYAVFS
jgi:hypothetical protein